MDRYHDEAVGVLAEEGAGCVDAPVVTLRPRSTSAARAADDRGTRGNSTTAHHACFIANSVKTEVVVEPQAG